MNEAAATMSNQKLARVMMYQLKAALKEDHPNLMVHVDDSVIRVWYFLVGNLPAPYIGGEYLFQLAAPDTFPERPPVFSFLTPNGVFEPGGKICISIGEFHATQAAGKTGAYGWRPALGMMGFAREVVNALIVPEALGGGIRVRNDPPDVKARLAAGSAAYNHKHHAGLVKSFQGFAESYPDLLVVRVRRMWRAAAAVAGVDFSSGALEKLLPVFAEAFGDDLWQFLAASLSGLLKAPQSGRSSESDAAHELSAAAILPRVADRIREALGERELPVRLALARALHARIMWELASESGGLPASQAAFRAAFDEFLEVLPNVCGSACRELVPAAMAEVGNAPEVFAEHHSELARFLCETDIDRKAQMGRDLAERVRAAVRAAATAYNIDDFIVALFASFN